VLHLGLLVVFRLLPGFNLGDDGGSSWRTIRSGNQNRTCPRRRGRKVDHSPAGANEATSSVLNLVAFFFAGGLSDSLLAFFFLGGLTLVALAISQAVEETCEEEVNDVKDEKRREKEKSERRDANEPAVFLAS